MKKTLSLLLLLALLLSCVCCAGTGSADTVEPVSPAAPKNAPGLTGSTLSPGAEIIPVSDDEGEEEEEEEGDDDEKEAVRLGPGPDRDPFALAASLSDYVPKRRSNFLSNWRTYEIKQKGPSTGSVTPEYEAVFSQGKLQQLEVEIELDDGREYEVLYSPDKKILRAEYETPEGQIYFDGSVWKDKNGKVVEGPDLSFMGAYFDAFRVEGEWYPYNTMSLVGLSLRDMYPDLTQRWYQVVPVDLRKEGVFHYRTAVSNMYYMGSCTVTVQNGTVTTDYELPPGHVYPKSDCLMWFTDISEITHDFLENPVGKYQFGQPVSIQDDLKGQDIALLFICNRITFRVPLTNGGAMPVRYYRGQDAVQQTLGEFEALFAQMKESSGKSE